MKSLLFCASFVGVIFSFIAVNKANSPTPKTACTSEIGLFPIWIQGKFGFINQNGDVIIPPKFRDLGTFVDGLAPARMDGRFGYINIEGVFVIPPTFDYATDFSGGFARVWRDGQFFFIHKNGQKAWDLDVKDATDFENGLAHVRIPKDSLWVEKVLDTLGHLNDVEQFPEWDGDLAIIKKVINDKEQVGIKAKNGKMIVPFGKYRSINPFVNGFAEVKIDKKDDSETGFINRKGALIFKLNKGMFVLDQYFSEGLLPVNTHTIPSDINSEQYITWVDTTGKKILEKRQDEDAMPFKTGRSFSGAIRNWYLMDKTGKQLSTNRFEWVSNPDFSTNKVFVAYHDTSKRFTDNLKWGIIDSMGEYLVPPQYDKVSEAEFQKQGILVAIADSIKNDESEDVYTGKSYHWGLIDTLGNWLIRPKFTDINPKGFQNGLLYAETESVYGYVNDKGEYVWQAPKQSLKDKTIRNVEPLNLAFMLRSYNYVYPSDYDTSRYRSDNVRCFAKTIQTNLAFPEGQFGVIVKENESAIFQKAFKGIKAFVFNSTKDSMDIDVQDNGLYITMQALDKKGAWRDIEYTLSSWCGNSYYSVKLKSNEYWDLTLPVYDGDIETTLRLAFSTKRISKYYKNVLPQFIYSNAFKGKINPAQFWRKEGHTPTSLMDSYND